MERSLNKYNVIVKAGEVATTAWNNHPKNERFVRNLLARSSVGGSDQVTFIDAHQASAIVALLPFREGGELIINGVDLNGIVINPNRGTYTILSTDSSHQPRYNTYRGRINYPLLLYRVANNKRAA